MLREVADVSQADWAMDKQDREQQRAKREQFRAMLDAQVHVHTVSRLSTAWSLACILVYIAVHIQLTRAFVLAPPSVQA